MRIVRLMALVADHASGMLGGCHLGKVPRFGCILFVATPAEIRDVRQLGNVRRGVVGVFRQWAMARFARDVSMLAGCARLRFTIVAENAGVLAGIRDGPLADHSERPRAIVAILPEGFRHNRAAHREENTESGH